MSSNSSFIVRELVEYHRKHWATCRMRQYEKEQDMAYCELHNGKDVTDQVRAKLAKELSCDEPKPSLA